MKNLLLFCIVNVLSHYTEQQLVVLKPGGTADEHSHELQQLDPSSRDGDENISAQKAEEGNDDPLSQAQTSSEESSEADYVKYPIERVKYPREWRSKAEPSGGKEESKLAGDKAMLLVLQIANKGKVPQTIGNEEKIRHWNKWISEVAAGNKGDIMAHPHIYQPNEYPNFGRRFVPVYPYTEESQNVMVAPDNKEIIPIPAPLEVVRLVAKESAMKEAAKPKDDSQDIMRNKVFRSGDYWNAIWTEKVEPKPALRMSDDNQILGTIKAQIKPGSEFYDLIAKMTKISPKLLYIINDK